MEWIAFADMISMKIDNLKAADREGLHQPDPFPEYLTGIY